MNINKALVRNCEDKTLKELLKEKASHLQGLADWCGGWKG